MGSPLNIVAMAPWCPPPEEMEGEIWSINNSHAAWRRDLRSYRPDLIIALDDLRRDEKTHPEYVREIVTAGCPVYNTHKSRKWKNVEEFPLHEIYPKFPKFCFDNSINYAFMLAMARNYGPISFWGTDFVRPYPKQLKTRSRLEWDERGFEDVPDWFKYYSDYAVAARAPGEPGQESFHYLLGIAHALDVATLHHRKTTALNKDRDSFFYGYQKQPKGLS